MAFEQEAVKTPAAIGHIIVTLYDRVAYLEQPASQGADFDVIIAFDDGTLARRSGNLVPHITSAQRQGLLDFMAALRAQAEEEIIGA